MDSNTLLKAHNIIKEFPGVKALNEVSFTLEKGEVHSLCGENGAGKSTLIKVLSGIHPYGSYQGFLELNGKKAEFKNIAYSEKAGIAVIYQELALVDELTVAENIFLGAEPKKGLWVDWNKLYSESNKLMEIFQLDINTSLKVEQLGIGQKQMVEIVKALRKNSNILILDEPTAALSEKEVKKLLSIIKQLKEKGISCIYISHKLDEVFEISDKITVLRDGKSIKTLNAKDTNDKEIVHLMVNRKLDDFYPKRVSKKGKEILNIKNLSVNFAENHKSNLKNLSFQVYEGEVLGIGGLMGSGRTELLMSIIGANIAETSGEIFLNNENILPNPSNALEKGIILVPEDRKKQGLILQNSIAFNMSLSELKKFSKLGLVNKELEINENKSFFNKLKIKAPSLETKAESLSGGNQQKIVLGKALMINPKIILLDEPTRGIDIGAKVEVYELINQLTEAGKAVILVSSELPELIGMSDRIIMLREGCIGGEFTAKEATQEKLLQAGLKG
ncbi:MAG: sugar ABC transporter ATP-binding protein [Candidatus Sericytochromatia bacterium]